MTFCSTRGPPGAATREGYLDILPAVAINLFLIICNYLITSLFAVFFTVLFLAGCDLFPGFPIDDALGEWDFADTTIGGKAATSIHLSVMSSGQMLDMRWDTSENGYLFACDGALSKNVFTGTYTGWDSMLPGDTEIVTGASISATLSMSGGKISVSFSGSGPLNGVSVTGGTLVVP